MPEFVELVKAYYKKKKELRVLEQARAIAVQEHGQKIAVKQGEVTTAEQAIFDALD